MRPAWLLGLCLLSISCTVEAKLTLPASGPARVDAVFTLATGARAAWASLRELDPSLPADPLEPGLVRGGFGAGATVTASPNRMSVSFPVADLRRGLPGLAAVDDGWDLTLDRDSVRQLVKGSSWSSSPVLDSVLPAPGAAVTEADYRDLLVYLLGSNLTEAAARATVDASTVVLTVETARALKSADGATVDGGKATWRWPLVRLLTLKSPLILRLRF